MTYQETVHWMFAQLPMYQRQGKTAFKKDLTNILAFTKELQNPHKNIKTIHVGGTNGKGSTSHMIASILQEAGYKVGLYTSPHLKSFTERIKINGKEIPEKAVTVFIKKHRSFLEKQKLSFFEMTVGMAFDYFSSEKVDIAVVEVGLGGRLDSTNIITPEVSIITNIGLDHTQFLGETLSEIAFEKAGIIKKSIPVIIGEQQKETENIFISRATELHCPIYFASDDVESYETDLLGDYQVNNVKTAVTAIKNISEFKITYTHIKKGLLNVVKNTHLKGRWQILQEHNPKIICDTAHNKEGLHYVLKQLKNECYKNLHIVIGVVADKNLDQILPMFPKKAQYYFCKPAIPRGLDEKKLYKKARAYGLRGVFFSSVSQALKKAKMNAEGNDVIYVGGSTFVVAEII